MTDAYANRIVRNALWLGLAVGLLAAQAAAEPLHKKQYELYSWKWAKDAAKAYRGAGETPEYLSKDMPMPALTAGEKALGFVVFQTHWMERSFPISVPTRKQITGRIRIFASLGEFEPATFLIRPQKDLKKVSIALAGSLKGPGGAEIPAANARLGIVNGWTKYGNYYQPIRTAIAPILKPVDIDKDYSEQFWVTLKVPHDAKPGLYQGRINILVGGSVARQLAMEVEVLPITLLQSDAAFGMYFDQGRVPSQWATADYMEKYYRDMAEHGMTSVTFYNMHGKMAGDKVVYDWKHNLTFKPPDPRYKVGLDVMLERAGKAGLLRKDIPVMYLGFAVDYSWISRRWKELNIPWPGGTPDAKDCKIIARRARERGWPEFLFYLMDEEGGINPYCGARMMLWMREAIRPIKAAGLRTVNALGHLYKKENYKKGHAKDRQLDKHELVVNEQGLVVDELVLENIYYWLGITLFSERTGVDEKVFDKMRALNKDYWLYSCSQPALHPEVDRFHYGLYTWRTGAKGFFMWHYTANAIPQKDGKTYWPWMDKSGVFHNMGDVWPMYAALSPLGPIPTISWEAAREGVDDYRYLLTLSKLIEKTHKSSNKKTRELAARARAAIETMMKNIPVDAARQRYTQMGAAAMRGWHTVATKDYDGFRRTLADWIVRLQPL
ncbi:MAG: DUF4091 domain-containing protein, partial [Phycisphaerae bacterium]|nr:DUF4091 domain-containing protein [Phycisphaerae bacterium]